MSEPFIGQVQVFGFNFAPQGWAKCDGQLLNISSFTALFSLLGTTYGGNGESTFGLPDLRGRVGLHLGNGPGLSPRTIGERDGAETVTLTSNQLPAHSHSLNAVAEVATTAKPGNNLLAAEMIYSDMGTDSVMSPQSIGNSGGGGSHNNMQPFLVMNWCISLVGLFPSRN